MRVLPPPLHPFTSDIRYWQAWAKPWVIAESPFLYTLWLDNDTIVDSDLTPLFEAIAQAPLLIDDGHSSPDGQFNEPGLYDRMPTGQTSRALNNGVMGLRMDRDGPLLRTWLDVTALAAADPTLRALIRWYDQGALIWAVSRLAIDVKRMRPWNRRRGAWAGGTYRNYTSPCELLDALPPRGENVVYHYAGKPKPYAWGSLEFDVAATTPADGPEYTGQTWQDRP